MAKRRIMVLILIAALACAFSGCKVNNQATDNSGKVNIVCTVFPVYDWVNKIVGENSDKFNITLLASGGDLHSYQPSAADIAAIHTCDLFVYVGGETDKWAEKIVATQKLNALSLLEINKGALLDAWHEHSHDHDGEDLAVYDEHVWLSLRLAQQTVSSLCDEMCNFDAADADIYKKNTYEYCEKLKALDEEFARTVKESENKSVVFADRFPFIYMTTDYGVECYAAFPGCSSDTNAGFEVVAHLAEKVKELKKNTLLVLENSNQEVAASIINASGMKNVEIAVMNSLQAIGADDAESNDYISIMEENLDAFKKALE